MQRLLIGLLVLTFPLSAAAEDLFFWSGAVGAAGIKLFIQGREYPQNHELAPNDDPKFFARHKDSMRGYYQYDKYKGELSLIGTIQDGTWKLEEHKGSVCTNCKPNGYLEGQQAGDTVTGFWISADSSKRVPFRIEKHVLSRRAVLGWLRGGEWGLDEAEGFYGANTMTGLHKATNGRWTAGGSSIVAGMREGYDASLSKEDKRLLDGFRIFVTDALDVVVRSGGQEILRIAYSDEPLFALDEITPETDGIGRIHGHRDEPGLTVGGINVGTTDRGKFDDVLKVDALPYDTPSAAHIEYGIADDVFRISLISADCCASQDLVFRRILPRKKKAR